MLLKKNQICFSFSLTKRKTIVLDFVLSVADRKNSIDRYQAANSSTSVKSKQYTIPLKFVHRQFVYKVVEPKLEL